MTPLLGRPLAVANVGVDFLADELERQGVPVARVDWQPPDHAAVEPLRLLATHAARVADANGLAVQKLQEADPQIVGVGRAHDVLQGMTERTILHAGPPIEWEDMSGPLRGAVIGAALHEGLAIDAADAARMAAAGEFEFGPCHDRGAVGPMAGVVSASMPMVIIEDATHGHRAFCTFNEGLGKVLRYGAYDGEVLDRLRWIDRVLAPTFALALKSLGEPIRLRPLIAQALEMGDEAHNRNRAATSLLLRALLPALIELDAPSHEVADVARFISRNDHFFLNFSMPAAKCAADSAAGVPASSIVVAMARNGTEFGVRVSGTGARWFTAPAAKVDELFLSSYGPGNANRDINDNTITETIGLGGFAMAAAPAIVGFVGGEVEDALRFSKSMYDICWSESESYRIPALGFRGTALGIDSARIVQTGVVPVINTGIAHREPGVGQIGAGLVKPPIEPFAAAVRALADSL